MWQRQLKANDPRANVGHPPCGDGVMGVSPSARQSTTSAAGRQELRGANGRVCATVEGDCLKKQIDGSKHFMQRPPGIAFDTAILEAAERAGVVVAWVRDRESGDVYTCQLDAFRQHGRPLDRGFGPQVCLPFTFWRVRRAGAPVQLALFGAGA